MGKTEKIEIEAKNVKKRDKKNSFSAKFLAKFRLEFYSIGIFFYKKIALIYTSKY